MPDKQKRDDFSDPMAVYEDSQSSLHLIPCDESQKEMMHTLDKNCICGPLPELINNNGKNERVLVHNKILH
jgi:hypothetical protein